MKRTQKQMLVMTALILGIMMASVHQAKAGLVVRARIGDPVVTVKVGHHEHRVVTRHLVPTVRFHHKITKKDRRVARRLAAVTCYRKGDLLDWRRAGYSWKRIARELDIPRRMVQAARSKASWERYLDQLYAHRSCRGDRHGFPRHKPVLR
jgi:hypothetical protein